jgi:hypothetical protein
MAEYVQIDPTNLYLPASRATGADPVKLARQIAKYGNSLAGMPAIEVTRGKDGNMRINDGVTRATRAAKLCPGQLVTVIVIHDLPKLNVTRTPQVKDKLP